MLSTAKSRRSERPCPATGKACGEVEAWGGTHLDDLEAAAQRRRVREHKDRPAGGRLQLLLKPGQLLLVHKDLMHAVLVPPEPDGGEAQAQHRAQLGCPVVPLPECLHKVLLLRPLMLWQEAQVERELLLEHPS